MIIKNYYPTPDSVIEKMVFGIDMSKIKTALDPEAGDGRLVIRLNEKKKYSSYRSNDILDIDTVEIDKDLQNVLKAKGLRVVHNDFLTFNTFKSYDLIIMNPPFDEGDKHLLKAMEIQKNGGQIVCLLNAETIKNPYSNIRQDLVRRLDEYDAKIEYLDGSFLQAERKTGVQVALIKIDIPKPERKSVIVEGLKRLENYDKTVDSTAQITDADQIKAIVQRYIFEVRVGLKLIDEFEAMKPYLLNNIEGTGGTIFDLKIDGSHYTITRDQYIQCVRAKYWKALFLSDTFVNIFTSKLRSEYYDKINELCHYDFSEYNIYSIKLEVVKSMNQSIEETIITLFDDLSHKHHWHDETSKNIHYYDGWKTNQSWFINKRVILPVYGCHELDYRFRDKVMDIEKVFNYLDGGRTNHIDLEETLKKAKDTKQTKKIQLKYFTVTVYLKGTCHIDFTNLELLKKFNLFGSQRKGWLPPSYGKKEYKEMTPEEKAVINSFEGELEYNKVLKNKDYYICEVGLPLLNG